MVSPCRNCCLSNPPVCREQCRVLSDYQVYLSTLVLDRHSVDPNDCGYKVEIHIDRGG